MGAHVRDSAAYVCWAIARAYNSQQIKPLITNLAPALLTTACYDREVQSQKMLRNNSCEKICCSWKDLPLHKLNIPCKAKLVQRNKFQKNPAHGLRTAYCFCRYFISSYDSVHCNCQQDSRQYVGWGNWKWSLMKVDPLRTPLKK